MKAMIVRNFGGPEVFEAAELPTPELKAGHVLVRVAATSVNMVDTMIREMGPAFLSGLSFFPFINTMAQT